MGEGSGSPVFVPMEHRTAGAEPVNPNHWHNQYGSHPQPFPNGKCEPKLLRILARTILAAEPKQAERPGQEQADGAGFRNGFR